MPAWLQPRAIALVTEGKGLPLLAFALALPEYQGRGLGTALITRSAASLQMAGRREPCCPLLSLPKTLELGDSPDNPQAKIRCLLRL
jgi:hypothetical protein